MIANAGDDIDPAQRRTRVERELADLFAIGLGPEEVDLRDHFGKASQLRSVLDGFSALWVLGGKPVALRTALHESGADAVVEGRLRSDLLVFAGYSAGPSMLGPRLPLSDEWFVRDLPG